VLLNRKENIYALALPSHSLNHLPDSDHKPQKAANTYCRGANLNQKETLQARQPKNKNKKAEPRTESKSMYIKQ
jgi:hypothetical protein